MKKQAKNSFSSSMDSSTKEDYSDSSDQRNFSSSSTLSSDLMEDGSSSSSSPSSSSSSSLSSSSSCNGPLYQLSDLMAQLPIKRGLSKYYQGKSESFASLASVENLEDLAKRENPYRKRIKLSPKTTISKKKSYARGGCFSSSSLKNNNNNNNTSINNNLVPSCRLQDF